MIKTYRVRAFTKTSIGGNPAGVVLDADKLTVENMKDIAKEVGYSETAFVLDSEKADFHLRFFTPVEEVDLCGHATIATFNLLRDLGKISIGDYTLETKVGILKLKVTETEVFMEQKKPEFRDILDLKEMIDCFQLKEDDVLKNLPIQVVSTGLMDILLPVKDIDTLQQLQPDFQAIRKLSEKYNVVGIHAFTLDTLHNSTCHCRNFAPLYGINEESATGTSNGALACYLTKYCKELVTTDFVFEQGYSMNQPSEIKVKLNVVNDEVEDVIVGGKAVLI